MHVIDFLSAERVVADASVTSKKRLLELVSQLTSPDVDNISERTIFDSLCGRERLGSTGLGEGVALPHGRIAGLDQVSAAFVRLSDPIDFDSPDGQPVDLAFALIAPEECNEQHLELLAQVAEMLKDGEYRNALRSASESVDLYNLLTNADSGQGANGSIDQRDRTLRGN
jgi:PTS system nitrogen regulatory IIA component